MEYFYNCFNKKICIKLEEENINMLNFWLKRFCPNIQIITGFEENIDLYIEFINSQKYDYFVNSINYEYSINTKRRNRKFCPV